MWTCPLTDKSLSRLNDRLIAAGFTALNIERATKKNFLLERAIRHESSSVTTKVCLNPDVACIFFKFGDVKKMGWRIKYPPMDSDDTQIAEFISDIMAAVESV